ncbi:MAG: RNA-binding S4 domain-containing protein [Bacillota bacterium]
MDSISITTEYIKLQQALKLSGIIGQGSDAKLIIGGGDVYVNGIVATERGKKIRGGDIVLVDGFGEFAVEYEEA